MLNRRLAVLVAVLIWVFVLAAPTVRAQYAEGLPPGILSVEVDGQPIDSATVPVLSNASPEITGRVELGVAVIELAVADGEVIRFSAELDDRGRFGVAVPQPLPDAQYSLYINDVLIGVFAVEDAAAAEEPREPGRLLDIARVVPYPSDFADLVPGLGFLDGRYYTLEEEAVRSAAAANRASAAEVRETQRGLAEAGWLQRFESRLSAPNADNPETFDVQVSSFVVEYASGADARSAFVTLTGDDPVVEAPVVGDESALTLLTGTTPDTGAEYQATRLVYRVGPMLGMIVYADLLNQQPDLALLDSVAQSVAARGVLVADRQVAPLGSMTLRLDASTTTGRLVRRDIYDVRAGTLTALFGEDETTRASRIELFTGTTDGFSSTTNGTLSQEPVRDAAADEPAEPAQPTPTSVILIEGEAPAPETPATPMSTDVNAAEPATAQVFMVSALYAFPGEDEADAWLTGQRDRLLAEAAAGSTAVSEAPEGPALGDVTATFAIHRTADAGEESADGFRLYTRVGAIVAVLEFVSIPNQALNGATSLMEMQVACIEEEGCTGSASVPGVLFGGAESQDAAAEEPAPGLTVESTPESVIIIEGDEAAPEATSQPKPTRQPRERRNRDTAEAPAG